MKNPAMDPDYHAVPGSGEERYKTYLGIPIIRDGKVIGALVVQTREQHMYVMPEVSLIHETGRLIEKTMSAA